MIAAFRSLTGAQRHAYFAALGGWSLDAFDFFIFVFCLKAISGDFHTTVKAVAEGVFLTLALRPVGALVFGWLAEKYGRRPILMLNVLSYSGVQLATAFAPDLATLLALRAVFGFAMGGEWGVGAALALETLPARNRGFFSGLLQEGYVLGYFLAALLYFLAFDHVGWRGLFMLSSASALLVLFIRFGVEESPAWLAGRTAQRASLAAVGGALRQNLPRLAYLIVLMSCLNAISHGSQDLYPTFLQVQHGYGTATTGRLTMLMNVGALFGGMCFGALSERIGRRRAIMLAAVLAVPLLPLWAFAQSVAWLAAGAFLMQFMVQGAWGVVPAHLNELSPPAVRAILPGFAYQLGNLVMARLSPMQAGFAEAHGNDYGTVLAWALALSAAALIFVIALGPEARAADLSVRS